MTENSSHPHRRWLLPALIALAIAGLAASIILAILYAASERQRTRDKVEASRELILQTEASNYVLCRSTGRTPKQCRLISRGVILKPNLRLDELEAAVARLGEARVQKLFVGGKGVQGDKGPNGGKGVRGEPGPAGPLGQPGPTGPRGPAGPRGPTGPPGRPVVGSPGPRGARGAVGRTGARGGAGPAGPAGAQGPVGPPGPAGLTCPPGFAPATIDLPGQRSVVYVCARS